MYVCVYILLLFSLWFITRYSFLCYKKGLLVVCSILYIIVYSANPSSQYFTFPSSPHSNRLFSLCLWLCFLFHKYGCNFYRHTLFTLWFMIPTSKVQREEYRLPQIHNLRSNHVMYILMPFLLLFPMNIHLETHIWLGWYCVIIY